MEHIKAYLRERFGFKSAIAINRTSGGMGKKEDSVKAIMNSASPA